MKEKKLNNFETELEKAEGEHARIDQMLGLMNSIQFQQYAKEPAAPVLEKYKRLYAADYSR
eukprot:12721461-Ditylum_brightwellii.AAC.1